MASTLNETVREDGLRVITKRLANTKKVCVASSALVGSAYDDSDKEGLFHFFEHMAFKGTKRRSLTEIVQIAEAKLTDFNAYTGNLRTTYLGESAYTKLDVLMDIIFDVYLNPTFPLEEIEKEKEVVLNETARNNDNDNSKAFYELCRLLWKQNPKRRQGCGTPDGLMNINQNVLSEAHQKWYVPSNTIVIALGLLDHESVVEKAFYFFARDTGRPARLSWADECDEVPAETLRTLERPGREKGVVMFGCKIPNFTGGREKDICCIISNMLGLGWESLLFQEVREKRGFAYRVFSGTHVDKLASYMWFGGEMLPRRIEDARKLMLELACAGEFKRDHFERTKEGITDTILVSLETMDDWERNIYMELVENGEPLSSLHNYANKRAKRMSSIEFEEIVDMRKKLFSQERIACVVAQPV